MLIDQLPQRHRHLFLNNTRVIDVTGNAEEFRSGISFPTERIEPSRSSSNNRRGDGDGLNIRDGSRTTEESNVGGEGRLKSGLSLLSFERFDQGRLFSADVRSRSSMEIDVEVVARSTGVLSDQSRLVRFGNRLLDVIRFLKEFSSNVNVG